MTCAAGAGERPGAAQGGARRPPGKGLGGGLRCRNPRAHRTTRGPGGHRPARRKPGDRTSTGKRPTGCTGGHPGSDDDDRDRRPTRLRFPSIELTSRCQLGCPHCYAQAGPTRGRSTLTVADWHRVISEAAALGTTTLRMIGGEPLLHPHCVRAGSSSCVRHPFR
ncbi:radical SAM protein [Streptomyces sp. NBC_01433]|uniref:radical SAM protein n=1 Tax=Streptomyces sp. NBC_01433 TaxID=2903864 RepID=UPI002B1CD6BF|nr:radical SAM protein [Streptomyces sp. NBC_01433]